MHEVVETPETRLRRLRMRSWRRGMKEMDLILGGFADEGLAGLSEPDLALYEALLSENDQDLYLWVTARTSGREGGGPPELAPILEKIAHHAAARFSG